MVNLNVGDELDQKFQGELIALIGNLHQKLSLAYVTPLITVLVTIEERPPQRIEVYVVYLVCPKIPLTTQFML
jgi:hypothetical protein